MREDAKGLCLILGGGGHASVLIECLLEGYSKRFLAILDGDSSLWGTEVLGVPVLGGESMLPELVSEGAASFLVGVGGTSDNAPRRRLFETALSHNLQPVILIHPTVICSRFAKIGSGSQLLPGSIVNAGATVGRNVIVNSGAIVEHDCRIGDHVHVASGAVLASTVSVGAGAHIGCGASVRQTISIGNGAVVGAGAVVVKDVAPHSVVVGVPARQMEDH
jgi:sugar O-acyltransferase (sialic acid O-acetyltransferase NeuD family)